jgi:hypothetical protein
MQGGQVVSKTDSLDDAGANAERPGNLEDAVTLGSLFPYSASTEGLTLRRPSFVPF